MSIQAINYILGQEVHPHKAKFLLFVLANYADEHGICYPSQKTLRKITGLNRKTIISYLKLLQGNGFLEDTERRIGRTNSVIIYRLIGFSDANLPESPMLRLPKRSSPKIGTPTYGSSPKNGTPKLSQTRSLRTKEEEPSARREPSPSGKPESVTEAIASGIAKNKLSKARRPTKKQTVFEFEKLWYQTWRQTFPDTPFVLWKVRDKDILRGYAKRFRDAGRKDFLEYLEWCIRYWRLVVDTHFKWMLNKPQFPAIPFLVRHSPIFESMFSHRKEGEMDMTKTTEERMIAELLRKGYEQSTAEREVSERLGLHKQRQTIKEESKRLERKALWLQSQQPWLFERARTIAKQVIAANPGASAQEMEKLTDAELEKLYGEVEKGFGAYEENRSANT